MSASRQHRHRTRRSLGRVILRIEVGEVDHVEMLIEGGWLSRAEEEDRAAIVLATERLVAWLARPANDA